MPGLARLATIMKARIIVIVEVEDILS